MRRVYALSLGLLAVVAVAGLAFAQGSDRRGREQSRAGEQRMLPATAVTEMQRACDNGNCEACGHLAELYRKGDGVPRDDAQAARLAERACGAQGSQRPGVLGTIGENPAFLQRTCDGGDATSCRKLASLYEDGRGVPKNLGRAAQLYERACAGGKGLGCFRLGLMYDLGTAFPRDLGKAARLYQQACDLDDQFGCLNLGGFYEQGRSVPRDPARAAQLYQKACDLGNAMGCQKRGAEAPRSQGPASNEDEGARRRRSGERPRR